MSLVLSGLKWVKMRLDFVMVGKAGGYLIANQLDIALSQTLEMLKCN